MLPKMVLRTYRSFAKDLKTCSRKASEGFFMQLLLPLQHRHRRHHLRDPEMSDVGF